ncbi:hypothetical protein ACIHFD_49610 [Nonomuraea sp. NPDC051941]|uniref:hypothetical protein n=1 Tax=Nonomuraea sp. NPDC051941 TaxID=3364373 RepID=UPI0037C6AD68
MAAGLYDLLIEAGTDYDRVLTLTDQTPERVPLDLTGCHVRAQIRPNHSRNAPLLHDLAPNLAITNPAGGVIALRIPGEASAAWAWRTGVWDLEVVDAGGAPLRLLKGAVRVSPEVTR